MISRVEYIEEENLIFGGQREEKDPRIGLSNFGPYRHSSETDSFENIRLGIVGTRVVIEKLKSILELLKDPIPSREHNKWLYPDFPGFSKKSKFNCAVSISPNWQEVIIQNEIEDVVSIENVNERIGKAVRLYLTKIENILDDDNPPHVVLCGLPHLIEEYCGISKKTRGAKIPKLTEIEKQIMRFKQQNQKFLSDWAIEVEEKTEKKIGGYDFRNALKGKLMGLNSPRPIQLLRESTMEDILGYEFSRKRGSQEPASFAWNLSTAIYYKANGKPWRLAKLRPDTCYVGISFYKDKLSFNQNIQTSMAQVFTYSGEGLVLRGTEVYIDEFNREPHLSEKQAFDLLVSALEKYSQKKWNTAITGRRSQI